MRRRLAVLLGAVLAASALAMVAPSSASATTLCAGVGSATTGALVYPVTVNTTTPSVTVNQPRTVGFGFAVSSGTGACVSDDLTTGALTAGGTLTGWCGHSSGQGTTNTGANFAYVSAGTFLVVTGHVIGLVNAAPNPLVANNSCLTGATEFIVNGAALALHCLVLNSSLVTVPIPETLTTVLGAVSVHTDQLNYHTSVCVPGPL